MSTFEIILANGAQAHFRRDFAKYFIGDNHFTEESLINLSGSEKAFASGLVVGMITTAGANQGKIIPWVAGAIDGSEVPIGILREEITLANAAESVVSVCNEGIVDESIVSIDAGTATPLDAVYAAGKQLRYLLISESAGLRFESVTQLSRPDNE